MAMRSGVTDGTPQAIVFGPGEVLVNYSVGYGTGTSLGATLGGATFDPGVSLRNVEVDGLPGPTKGLVHKDAVAPTLVVRLKEMTQDNLTRAIAGAVQSAQSGEDNHIIGGPIDDASYLENVALVAENQAGQEMVVIIYNALPTAIAAVNFPDKGEPVLEVTFTGHFDLADLESEPWRIIAIPEGS